MPKRDQIDPVNSDTDIREILKSLMENQIKKCDLKNTIQEALEPFNERLTTMEETMEVHTEEISTLQEDIRSLQSGLDSMKKDLEKWKKNGTASLEQANNMEQYSRKYSIKIFDLKPVTLPGVKYESLNMCRQLVVQYAKGILDLDINSDFICAAHRLPKNKSEKYKHQPKPMYVKFLRMEDKINFMRAYKERGIRNDQPVVKNDITPKNMKLLSAIFNDTEQYAYGFYYNGFIYGMTKDFYKMGPIGYLEDLTALFNKRKTAGTYSPPPDEEEEAEESSSQDTFQIDTAVKNAAFSKRGGKGRGTGTTRKTSLRSGNDN